MADSSLNNNTTPDANIKYVPKSLCSLSSDCPAWLKRSQASFPSTVPVKYAATAATAVNIMRRKETSPIALFFAKRLMISNSSTIIGNAMIKCAIGGCISTGISNGNGTSGILNGSTGNSIFLPFLKLI